MFGPTANNRVDCQGAGLVFRPIRHQTEAKGAIAILFIALDKLGRLSSASPPLTAPCREPLVLLSGLHLSRAQPVKHAGRGVPGADDYDAFLDLMAESSVRTPMRILAYCLPNHFHLALWPREDGDVSRWMHWLMTTHVRRYLGRYRSSGHVWQGRFKAFPTQEDEHLLTCCGTSRATLCERGWLSERKMAVVEPALALCARASAGAVGAGHGAACNAVGGGRQRCDRRHRLGEHPAIGAPGPSVRDVRMDA